jgi:hypothetical protein
LALTWASIRVECFRHLVESTPWQMEAVLRTKQGGVQLNIRKVFLIFCTLSVEQNNMWVLPHWVCLHARQSFDIKLIMAVGRVWK